MILWRTSGHCVKAYQRACGCHLYQIARFVGQHRATLELGVRAGHVSRTVRRFLALLRLYRRLLSRHERLRALYLLETGREPEYLTSALEARHVEELPDDSGLESPTGLHRHRVDLEVSDCVVAAIIGGMAESGDSRLSPGGEIPQGTISDGIRHCLRTWTADDDPDRYPGALRMDDAAALERLADWWQESYGPLGAATERDIREIAGRLRCSGSSVGAGFDDMPDLD